MHTYEKVLSAIIDLKIQDDERDKIADDLHDYVIATSYLDDDDIMILSSIEKRIRGIK